MSYEGTPRNSFRASLGRDPNASPVVADKHARADRLSEGLIQVAVPRHEGRRTNHRDGDRRVLTEQQAIVRKEGKEHRIALLNLSGGGAMVESDLEVLMWDRLTLVLGDFGEVECAVRWVRAKRFGLEFAHETRIDCDAQTLDETLRAVIQKSFPESRSSDAEPSDDAPVRPAASPEDGSCHRGETRHPLIWSGLVHHDHETVVARLRNISAHGALIETSSALPEGGDVLLDLGNAGTVAATLCWVRGDQAGLSFNDEFDIRSLAKSKPEVAPSTWTRPDYLRDDSTETSPWASEWGRLTLKELGRSLAG